MNDNVFLDTNIFVYLYSEDEPEKQFIALKAVDKFHCVTSTQVLNEFCSVCLRKLGISSNEILQSIKEIIENCELCNKVIISLIISFNLLPYFAQKFLHSFRILCLNDFQQNSQFLANLF